MSIEPTARIDASEQTADRQLSRGEKFGCFALVLLVATLLIGGPFEQLLLGWVYYSIRRVAQLGGVVGLAAVVIILIVVSAYRARRAKPIDHAGDSTPQARRRLVWLSLWLLVASTAAVSAGRQFRMLISEDDAHASRRRIMGPVGSAIEAAREQARHSQTRNNLKQIGLAVHNAFENGLAIPGGTMDQDGTLLHGWPIALSHYMTYYAPDIDWSQPWNEPPNDKLYRCALRDYLNPSMPGPVFDAEGYGLAHVAGNMHVLRMQIVENPRANQWMGSNALKTPGVIAGGAHTVLIGTIGVQPRPWGYPANLRDPAAGINQSPEGFGGPPGWNGAMFLMCDGSVRFVGNNTAPEVLRAMSGAPRGD